MQRSKLVTGFGQSRWARRAEVSTVGDSFFQANIASEQRTLFGVFGEHGEHSPLGLFAVFATLGARWRRVARPFEGELLGARLAGADAAAVGVGSPLVQGHDLGVRRDVA